MATFTKSISIISVPTRSKIAEALRGVPRVPLAICFIFIFLGIFGQWLTPNDPIAVNTLAMLKPPLFSDGHHFYLLGTDQIGRCIFSRILVGARASMVVSLSAVFLAGTVGTILAMVSGYFGGWFETIVMRLTDMMFSLPILVFALVLAAIIGPGLINIVLILGLVGWAPYARLLRSEVLQIKEEGFIKLAKVAGCSRSRILLRHIFPNITNTLVVMATLQVGIMIIAEASLSFLGLGIQPPTPAWGSMVDQGKYFLTSAWWISAFPGLAILLTVFSINLLGDWLRVRLDPRFRQI